MPRPMRLSRLLGLASRTTVDAGHAIRALGIALDRARELGQDRVLVTCADDTLTSAKTIESQGRVHKDVRAEKRRYWTTL